MRHVRIVDELIQDVHYAVRVLRRSPGFAVAAILIMALGIGANAAMFSLIHAVLLRDLPYPDAGRLVRMVEQGNNGPMWVAWPDYVDWRAMARVGLAVAGAIPRERPGDRRAGVRAVQPGRRHAPVLSRVRAAPRDGDVRQGRPPTG